MKKISIVALLSLALIAGRGVNETAVPAQRENTSQFLIGVLRADGALIPFAQYSNGGWWNPWPKPRQSGERIYAETTEVIPHSLDDLPEPWFIQCGTIPNPWFRWSSSGTAIEALATRVVQVRSHSGSNWGLQVDLRKQTSKDPLHDVAGVAVTARQKVEPFIQIEPASPQAKEIGSFIKQVFNEDETAKSGQRRIDTAPSLTSLYASNSVVNGERLYYFEAEKEYQKRGPSGDIECSDISLFHGWLSTTDKGGMGMLASNLTFTDCDKKGASSMIPLGTMTIDDRMFLLVIEHGWDSQAYTILELDQSGLNRVLQTDGG